MINSRSIAELHPRVATMATKFLDEINTDPWMRDRGYSVIVISTYRDYESQQALFDQGRTKPGRIVTNAQPGHSFHNHRLAFDVLPLKNGKPMWGTTTDEERTVWERVGRFGEHQGLEWAGRWLTFPEYGHFQFTGGHPVQYFAGGGEL